MVSHSMLRSVQTRKPSFAQERFAKIIATDVACFQSSIEINNDTLSVTIDALIDMADK
jgi:trehalose/maltose hydrolase-like predicted phosphorylase